MQAGALRQAAAAISRLQNTVPAFSPAIQWMATPEAAQIASGKTALENKHVAMKEVSDAVAIDTLGADDPRSTMQTSRPAGDAVDGPGIEQPGSMAEWAANEQPGGIADWTAIEKPGNAVDGPGIEQPAGIANGTAHEQPGDKADGTAQEQPGSATADAGGVRDQEAAQEAWEAAREQPLPSSSHDAHAPQAHKAADQQQHEAIATINDSRQGVASEPQQAAVVKLEPVDVSCGEQGPQQSLQDGDGTTDFKAEVVANNQAIDGAEEGQAAVAAPDRKPKRRGRKAKAPSEQAENREASAQESHEGAGQQAKPRGRKGQRATAEPEPLGERIQTEAQVSLGL